MKEEFICELQMYIKKATGQPSANVKIYLSKCKCKDLFVEVHLFACANVYANGQPSFFPRE